MWSAGRITPPFPSPPMRAFSSLMAWATLASPTGARTNRPPIARVASSTTRDVERFATTDRLTVRPSQDRADRERQGVVLPDRPAGLVHQGQSVHVGVHRHPDVRPHLPN